MPKQSSDLESLRSKNIKRAITHDPTTFGYEVMTKYNIGWRPYWILRLWRPQWPPALALSTNEFSMVWSTCVPNFMLVDKSAQYHPKWSLSFSTNRELARLLTKQLQSQVGSLQTAHCRAIYCTQSVGYTSRPCMRYNSRWEDSASFTV